MPKPEDRHPGPGYPQCLTYTFPVKGERLKQELFHNGCGYNTLAFLGMVTPKQALAEIEKKALSESLELYKTKIHTLLQKKL